MSERDIDKQGHRQRVHKRFNCNNGEAMADYELLEFLLMYSIPRRDVKPIAKELLRRFGSFVDVIYASDSELMQTKWVKSNTCDLFHLIVATIKRVCLNKLHDNQMPLLVSVDAVIDYCRAALAYSEVEELHVIFLDASCRLISAELLQKGTLTGVSASPREIVRMALDKKATQVILVHNHPSDNLTPSDNDIYVTGRIEQACEVFGIKLQDHIIIGKTGYFSFRAHKMLIAED